MATWSSCLALWWHSTAWQSHVAEKSVHLLMGRKQRERKKQLGPQYPFLECPRAVSVGGCDKIPDQKERVRVVRTGTQGKNLEVETKADALEECCLLACSLWLAQAAFLHSQYHQMVLQLKFPLPMWF